MFVSSMLLSSALAAPVWVHGELADADGEPIDGSLNLDLALYSDADGEAQVWSESQAVRFEQGAFAVVLGENAALPDGLFRDHPSLWLGIAVDSDPEMPLLEIGSVPYAEWSQQAGDALMVDGRTVDDVVGLSQDVCFDTEAELTAVLNDNYVPNLPCPGGTILMRSGGSWVCQTLTSQTLSASQITLGVLSPNVFDAYADLDGAGRLDGNAGTDLMTRTTADSRYVNVGEALSANVITSGTLDVNRFDAYDDLRRSNRLDNSQSTDILLQGDVYGCGTYVPIRGGACPVVGIPPVPGGGTNGPNCDEVPVGAMCESDGECGLSNSLNNCDDAFGVQDDWYIRIR